MEKENVQLSNKKELIAQLCGLGWNEQDEVIDALISQENFQEA